MKIINVDLKKIEQNENSRVIYKQSDLSELMQSMKKDGLLQPVGVKELEKGKYEAVFGNRRIMAAKKLGWHDIPAHVLDAETENDRDVLNLVENFKRQNTTVSEDGRIFQALLSRGLTKDEIAARVGIGKERVELALEVFNDVPDDIKKKIVNRIPGQHKKSGQISATAAHTILNLRKTHALNRKQTRALMHYASEDGASLSHIQHVAPLIRDGWTVRDAIQEVGKLSRVVMYVFIDERRIEKLEKKHGTTITQQLWAQLENNKELGVRRMSTSGPQFKVRDRSKEA